MDDVVYLNSKRFFLVVVLEVVVYKALSLALLAIVPPLPVCVLVLSGLVVTAIFIRLFFVFLPL